MKEELLKIYRYIRVCIFYHHGWEFNRMKMMKDMQHDIFLYLIDKKKKEVLDPPTKRYIFILANYYPIYLKNYKYSNKYEKILLDLEGNPIEPGISYFINGDTLHDLNLIENKPKEVLTAKSANARPILVTFFNGGQEIYDSIDIFVKKIGCRRSTVNIWLRFGIPKRTTHSRKRHIGNRVGKYDHILKIEYLV